MQPQHNGGKMGMLKRQKYYFDPRVDTDNWNKVINTLFPEPKFHDVIEAHGVEGYVDAQWVIHFKVVDDKPYSDGPRYSRLLKSLWDNFGPTFDDYGVQLMNNHTGLPVPVR